MVELIPHGVYLLDGKTIVADPAGLPSADEARENTVRNEFYHNGLKIN